MTAQDYLDGVERHYLGERFVSALVRSPRDGAYVGVARVLNGETLHRTAEHATSEAAALALAQMCGATKHDGAAHVTVDLRATGDGWTLHYPTGMTPGRSPLDAVAHALHIARWHADNEQVLRSRPCSCVGDGGHALACANVWGE